MRLYLLNNSKTIRLILTVVVFFIINNSLHAQYVVSTYAGTTGGFSDGDTSTAQFKKPFGMCIDATGNLFIADPDNNRIRKISVDGIVSTVSGNGTAGYIDGPVADAEFNEPSDLCLDALGNMYVSDFNNQRIRMISTDGNVYTIAGNGTEGFVDGSADVAEFDYPRGIVINTDGNLFIGDSWNHRIRKIDMGTGMVSTFAGGGNITGVASVGDYIDASDTSARFYTPSGLGIDSMNNIYVADAYNHRIRKIDPTGNVITIAGSGPTGPDLGGYADGDLATGLLNTPTEVFIAGDGKIYIGDTFNDRVRMIESDILYTIAGNGNAGYVNGPDSLAEFNYTRGIVTDATGEYIYVCDYNNHRIRKIEQSEITAIQNTNDPIDISMFSNPVSSDGILMFEIRNNAIKGEVVLTDLLGQIIEQLDIPGPGNYSLELSACKSGNYLLIYYANGSFVTRKIIVTD